MSVEHIKMDQLEDKVGGRFRLVTIFQKRIRELQRGLPPLVDSDSTTLEDIVAEEIMQEKIWLEFGDKADELRLERKEEMKTLARERRARDAAIAETQETPPPIGERPIAPGT